MSTPEHTDAFSDGWTAEQALEGLRPLVALARQVTGKQRMYLMTEV
jgi:hypothetical protein